MNMRERIAELARKFHSGSCYPDALDFEVDAFVDAVLAALSDPTPEMIHTAEGAYHRARADGGYGSRGAAFHAAIVAAIRKAGD